MRHRLSRPRKLEKSDDRSAFSSGAPELDDWFRRFSWENQAANKATTYVSRADGVVAGYYAIAMAAYARLDAPSALSKNRPAQLPCILLARLAVDSPFQGQGWGAELLRDALHRSVMLSDSIGAAAVLVHSRDQQAKDFYLANGDFLQSPVEELHLMVSMKALRRYFG